MTRAAEVAAALERWEKRAEYLRAFSSDPMSKAADAGDALAALLREPQPEPVYTDDTPLMLKYREADEPAPVGGEDDVELIRVARGAALNPVVGRSVRNLLEDLATRLETAMADVARLREVMNRRGMSCAPDQDMMRMAKERDEARADVARLTEELGQTKLLLRSIRQSAHDSAVNFRKCEVRRLELEAKLARGEDVARWEGSGS